MAPCALSYASDGGAARICQRGAKARELYTVYKTLYNVHGCLVVCLMPILYMYMYMTV